MSDFALSLSVAGLLLLVGSLAGFGWGRYLSERARCEDLRHLLAYQTIAPNGQTYEVIPADPEPEERIAKATLPPLITADMVDEGTNQLLTLARESGIELSREQARANALQMLTEAHGLAS